LDNYYNSFPEALKRVSKIASDELPPNATELDKQSCEIDGIDCDLTREDQVRAAFERYGKGGIWGVIHVAVCDFISTVLTRVTEILVEFR
jgi:UDP-glucose 4-epimerase